MSGSGCGRVVYWFCLYSLTGIQVNGLTVTVRRLTKRSSWCYISSLDGSENIFSLRVHTGPPGPPKTDTRGRSTCCVYLGRHVPGCAYLVYQRYLREREKSHLNYKFLSHFYRHIALIR
ncbi:hypothetical protein BJ166DRAFT_363957 [Pestalotiopsis sp. NC0098]|nr:hypothetical protein BJ166DRAFT_363957 [Pestalotiopsis sp. NC0098]